MSFLQAYEDHLIHYLPPNAQHVAELMLSRMSLAELLRMRDTGDRELFLMTQHNVSDDLWPDILRAVTLAKVTYFEPSDLLDQAKILLLVKLAVESAGFSLTIPLPQIVASVKQDYPRLTRWLVAMAQLLAKQRKTSAS